MDDTRDEQGIPVKGPDLSRGVPPREESGSQNIDGIPHAAPADSPISHRQNSHGNTFRPNHLLRPLRLGRFREATVLCTTLGSSIRPELLVDD